MGQTDQYIERPDPCMGGGTDLCMRRTDLYMGRTQSKCRIKTFPLKLNWLLKGKIKKKKTFLLSKIRCITKDYCLVFQNKGKKTNIAPTAVNTW